jgi:hypothetical protein
MTALGLRVEAGAIYKTESRSARFLTLIVHYGRPAGHSQYVQARVPLVSTEYFRHHNWREAAKSHGLSYFGVRAGRLGLHTPSTMGDQQHSPEEVTNDSLPVVARSMGCTDPFVGNPFPQDHRESVRAIYFLRCEHRGADRVKTPIVLISGCFSPCSYLLVIRFKFTYLYVPFLKSLQPVFNSLAGLQVVIQSLMGLLAGWGIGAAAMKAALAVRSQLVVESTLVKVANKSVGSRYHPSLSDRKPSFQGSVNPDQLYKIVVFQGDFLDAKSVDGRNGVPCFLN